MASGHIFHILKCKTRFQAEKPASKYFGLFSSPIETAHSADVSPLPRLRIVHGIECEPPCAAIPAASQPSSCRQRSPPQRRRGGAEASYIVLRLQLWRCSACAAAAVDAPELWRHRSNAPDHAATAGGPGLGPEQLSPSPSPPQRSPGAAAPSSCARLACDARLDKLGRTEDQQISALSISNPLCKYNDFGRAEHVFPYLKNLLCCFDDFGWINGLKHRSGLIINFDLHFMVNINK